MAAARLLLLFFFSLAWSEAFGQNVVPKSVYVFGDSLADVGNNNHLSTLLKADFPHNGVDFSGGKPTGRFSNGKNAVDFLADKLGLPSPPPYLSISSNSNSSELFLNGVNFASGGAGVLDTTNKGGCLSLNKQISYFSAAYASMVGQIGAVQTESHLANSIFAILIGSNDIFSYLKNSKTTQFQFVGSLSSTLQLQLKKMYNYGARKFVFIGVGPLGCCPAQRNQNKSGDCRVSANSISDHYNQAVASLLQDMKLQHNDMNYSFFNTSLALSELIDDSANYGFTEIKAACCGLGKLNAQVACTPISHLCANRSNHIFWDLYHPTEAAAAVLVSHVVDGTWPLVYPMNARQLDAI
ncbi:GDSL esterase/lipase At5g55050-like [Phalaenopsis equestris]|uniref:GDSL esterase/lipase At5g55050-like n=1 Tax=Phalaenopsis equestris TaxID=78828 RepID=UPI0009E640EC|nr:GDSL esterase/lipase At5g55050-like [Phalaenopsis equestris]